MKIPENTKKKVHEYLSDEEKVLEKFDHLYQVNPTNAIIIAK